MALIQWNDTFSVGIVSIDQQHKQIVKMVNEFHEAICQNKSKEHMGKLLSGLVDYAASHFATEEKYFKEFGFIGRVAHEAEHRDLETKAVEMKKRFEKGQLLLTVEVANFLRDWLTNHIQGSDKKYGPFLSAKGVK